MIRVSRLVTHVELEDDGMTSGSLGFRARLMAELTTGRAVLLVDDRGWSSSFSYSIAEGRSGGPSAFLKSMTPAKRAREPLDSLTAEEVESTARMVVGPDEPVGEQSQEDAERSQEDAERAHWSWVSRRLGEFGAQVDAEELATLQHDVVLGDRLVGLLTRTGSTKS